MRRALVILAIMVSLPLLSLCQTAADKENEAKYFDGYAKYLDHLKTCTPYTWSFEHLPANPSVSGKNIIKGQLQGNCFVTEFQYMEGHESEPTIQRCEYSPESIAFMTSKAMYQDARTRESGTPGRPSHAEVEAAHRSMQECSPPA